MTTNRAYNYIFHKNKIVPFKKYFLFINFELITLPNHERINAYYNNMHNDGKHFIIIDWIPKPLVLLSSHLLFRPSFYIKVSKNPWNNFLNHRSFGSLLLKSKEATKPQIIYWFIYVSINSKSICIGFDTGYFLINYEEQWLFITVNSNGKYPRKYQIILRFISHHSNEERKKKNFLSGKCVEK